MIELINIHNIGKEMYDELDFMEIQNIREIKGKQRSGYDKAQF